VSLPKVLTEDDYSRIIGSNAIFARKFDVQASAKLIELLEQNVLGP
jgi:hypothetical protein